MGTNRIRVVRQGRRSRADGRQSLVSKRFSWVGRTGCPWRDLAKEFGRWHTVRMRFFRWPRNGGARDPRRGRRDRHRACVDQLDHRAFAPAFVRGAKKNRPQALSRSRSGLTTELHLADGAVGRPLRLIAATGQAADITCANEVVEHLRTAAAIADKGHDSDTIAATIHAAGAKVVILPRSNRVTKRRYSRVLYRTRNFVERFFNRIKHFRRDATRYGKLADDYLAFASRACALGPLLRMWPEPGLSEGALCAKYSFSGEKTMEEQKIQVVLADDHPFVITGLLEALARYRNVKVISTADSSTALIKILDVHECDVLVTDYVMPGGTHGDGVSLIRFLRERFPTTRIVLLSVVHEPAVVRSLLALGVRCMLSKADPSHHLIAAIHGAFANEQYFSPKMEAIVNQIEMNRPAPRNGGLTTREWEVVRLYVAGHGITEISKMFARSKQTISAQKASAMRKLGIESDVDLIRWMFGVEMESAVLSEGGRDTSAAGLSRAISSDVST
nr:IS5 family transposase [Burkholderia ubonensis]